VDLLAEYFMSAPITRVGGVSERGDGGMKAVDAKENGAALISRDGDENDILDCFVGVEALYGDDEGISGGALLASRVAL